MHIERCDATLGAVVTDVELASICEDEWTAVQAAFHEHAVLVFPGQHLSHAEQLAFTQRVGDIEHIVGDAGWVSISNVDGDGNIRPPDAPLMEIIRGNLFWHTDSSFKPLSAKASVLSAHVLPASGGETEWADMRHAYDTLDEETKRHISGLCAHHSLEYSQARAGFRDRTFEYGFNGEAAPLRPLVKQHPVTGRPALFIGRHAHGIPGLSSDESEALLDRLLEHACQPPRILRHQWQVGDVVMWDNRCVLHRARPWSLDEARTMVHTRVAGDRATELV